MRAKFPAMMLELYPGRNGFPRIHDDYTQADHDKAILKHREECAQKQTRFGHSQVKAPFINEDGEVKEIRAYDVFTGNTKHLIQIGPDFSSVEDMRAKFPAMMLELYPGRNGFPRIHDDYTQADHDKAILKHREVCAQKQTTFNHSHVKVPFINEDGEVKEIRAYDVFTGNTKHYIKITPKWSSVEDMKAKFPAMMLELYPGRNGFPRIHDDYTQADHDKAILNNREECAQKQTRFRHSHVKVPFINEGGQVKEISVENAWTGDRKHFIIITPKDWRSVKDNLKRGFTQQSQGPLHQRGRPS